MQGPFLREYGRDATVNFHVYEVDGIDLRKDATIGTADIFVMIDEATEVASDNAATDEGRGYSVVVPAVDMAGKRITLYVEDQTATKVWLDEVIVIETINHPDAMHPNGVTLTGLADAGAATNEIDLGTIGSATNDLYLGQIVEIYEGTGLGQSRPIVGYVGSTKIATISGTWATSPDATSRYRVRFAAVGEVTVPTAADNADAVLDELTAGHTTPGSLAVAVTDTLADTADMQPKIGSPVNTDLVGDIAAIPLPASLTVGGRVKTAVEVFNGRLISGVGSEADPFVENGPEV